MVTTAAPNDAARVRVGRMLVALWRLGRYRFVAGGFLLYALGAALARARGSLDVHAYVLGQGFITAVQLMTHYGNDYFDIESDRANAVSATPWSGGSGVLLEGLVPPRLARDIALGFGALALIIAALIVTTHRTAPSMPVLFLLTLVLSWEYSAPPLRLHARGLGAPTAAIVVGGLTPLVGYGMQAGSWSHEALLSVLPIVMAQFALILVLDFPDAEGDARTGKRTLVVLWGTTRALALAVGAVVLVYAMLPLLIRANVGRHVIIFVAATLPIGAWLVCVLLWGAWRRGGAKGRLVWSGILWFAAVSTAALIGAVIDVVVS